MHFSGSQRKLLEQEGSRRLQIRSQGAFWYLAWLLGVSGWSQSRSRVSAEVMNKRQTCWRSIGGRGDNKLRGFINTQIWGVFFVSFRLFFLHFISHLCMKKCQFRCWPRMCFKGGRAEKKHKMYTKWEGVYEGLRVYDSGDDKMSEKRRHLSGKRRVAPWRRDTGLFHPFTNKTKKHLYFTPLTAFRQPTPNPANSCWVLTRLDTRLAQQSAKKKNKKQKNAWEKKQCEEKNKIK